MKLKKPLIIFSLLLFSKFSFGNNCIKNVEESFDQINNQSQKIKIKTKDYFDKNLFRLTMKNKWGVDNHFQGATLIPNTNGKYFVISGADVKTQKSWLYFGKIERNKSKITSELIYRFDDIIVKDQRWHVGGLGIHQNILAITMETIKSAKTSALYFYKINIDQSNDKISLEKFPFEITRNNRGGGGVDILPMHNQTDLYQVFSFTKSGQYYAFSQYKNINLNQINPYEGQDDIEAQEYQIYPLKIFGGSNVDVVNDCDGNLFMFSMQNESFIPPINTKKNGIEFYKFHPIKMDTNEEPSEKNLEFVKFKKFHCKNKCNFRAAAGIVNDNGSLKVFSSNYFRSKRGKIIFGKLFE